MNSSALVGTVLAGRFRVEALLGQGAMGEVYVAVHEALGRKVAVKVLHEAVEHDERLVERFRREARAASHLDHPNIVGITDFGRTEEARLYLVMEYIPGVSLQEAIGAAEPGRLPYPRVVPILAQLCSAVQAAHEAGVVHRDLKPDNILLGKGRDDLEVVKVLDFGLAKMMQDPQLSRLTRKGEIFGTPAYMSPEQARGDAVDHRADLYSVGIVAYELFSGRLPFLYSSMPRLLIAHQQEPPVPPSRHLGREDWPIPEEIEQTILRCLAKAPEARPQSIAELGDLLEARRQRLAATPSRFIPQVVLRNVAAAVDPRSPPSLPTDWCEVSLEPTRSDALGATMAGEHPLEEDDLELVPEEPGRESAIPSGAPTDWYWSRIIAKAKTLAQQMRDLRLGTVELTTRLSELAGLEERTSSLEMEIALARSRIDDLEGLAHEAETRLRLAVMDLSMERGRLIDESGAASAAIHDLDYQIRTLEERLVELHRERAEKLRALEDAISARERHVEHFRRVQAETEARLLNLLHRVRPRPCPGDIDGAYLRIEALLRAMQASQGQ